jgi:hypothetical protein
LNIILDLQSRLSSFSDAESLKSACDIALESMIAHDKADIWLASVHDFASNYRGYHYETGISATSAYLKNMRESIVYIIEHANEFLYPTRICTYTKNSPN